MCGLEGVTENNSRPRQRRRIINRNCEDGYSRLLNDNFSENFVYIESQFQQRFQIRKQLYLQIIDALSNHDPYF